jgi:hypothetical protein
MSKDNLIRFIQSVLPMHHAKAELIGINSGGRKQPETSIY